MSGLQRRVVHEEASPFEATIAGLDLAHLRAAFAELFDRTMLGVQRAGLDADDVVLEREMLLGAADAAAVWRSVDFLSDAARFRAHLERQAPSDRLIGRRLLDARVTALRVRAIAD
jgi:hypothetical protein